MLQKALNELAQQIRIRAKYDNFIGGKWVAPGQGPVLRATSRRSPASRSARSPARTAEDIETGARRRARRQGRLGQDLAGRARRRSCYKIADRMEAEPRSCSRSPRPGTTASRSARRLAADIPLAIDHFRYFAGCIRAQEGSIAEIDHDTVAYHFHEPLGVVGQIIPWNFPLLMAAWKLAPALAAGNCVVLKPAEQTPCIDPGADGPDRRPAARRACSTSSTASASRPASRSPQNKRIAKIAFTGETTTGRLIMQYAVREHHPGARSNSAASRPNIFFADVMAAGRRLLRQGARRLRDVRAQPGRGLHLPVARADPGVDLRQVHGARASRASKAIKQGNPLDTDDHDRRAGLQRPAREDPVLHRHRQAGRRQGADRRRAQPTSTATWPTATTSSRRSSRATTRCASSRRRSSARSCR